MVNALANALREFVNLLILLSTYHAEKKFAHLIRLNIRFHLVNQNFGCGGEGETVKKKTVAFSKATKCHSLTVRVHCVEC